MEILIPDHYVNSISERLQLYKDLNTIENEDEVKHLHRTNHRQVRKDSSGSRKTTTHNSFAMDC